MDNKELRKPTFIKISDIRPGVHCYHVYAKVIKAERSEIKRLSGDIVEICDGTVADDSGCVNFRLEGTNAQLVKTGDVIAIRNGRSEVVDEHIRLEVDKFGKVSQEEASLVKSANTEHNISEQPYEKKNRRGGRDGRD